MSRQEKERALLGMTYQMSLDAFLKESDQTVEYRQDHYQEACEILEEMKQVRSWAKKREIAKSALLLCEDCIEAILALGIYSESIFDTLRIYKQGMERFTMALGCDFFQQHIHDFYELPQTHAFFQMKFSYACALYEAGFLARAQTQFHEILALHPSDHFRAHYYLFACALYFEEMETCQQLMERYPPEDTFMQYARFLYDYKKMMVQEARQCLPILWDYNPHLYEILSYEIMNMTKVKQDYLPGSEEEAAYCYAILQKVIQPLSDLPLFLGKELRKEMR